MTATAPVELDPEPTLEVTLPPRTIASLELDAERNGLPVEGWLRLVLIGFAATSKRTDTR